MRRLICILATVFCLVSIGVAQEDSSSTIILDNNGWSDPSVGTWNPDTRTAALNQGLNEGIEIAVNNITLNGNGQTITGNGSGIGVLLEGRNGVIIQNLAVTNFELGIGLSSSNRNTITDNTVTGNNVSGISLLSSNNNNITGNTVTDDLSGISLVSSSDNILMDNNVSNNTLGLILGDSNGNNLTANTISSNFGGIQQTSSRGNTFRENTVSDNFLGISLENSSNNTIYNNNFIDNIIQAEVTDGGGNVFSLPAPVGGNYWSDWTTPDNDGDGFVDEPYVFREEVDNLPWTTQDGWQEGVM